MVVANDSGLMHVAAALDLPVFGVVRILLRGFHAATSGRAVVVERQAGRLPCSPCFARECPLGHLDCLRGITPRQVFDEMLALGVFEVCAGGTVRHGG